jgi:hypothetical protein
MRMTIEIISEAGQVQIISFDDMGTSANLYSLDILLNIDSNGRLTTI